MVHAKRSRGKEEVYSSKKRLFEKEYCSKIKRFCVKEFSFIIKISFIEVHFCTVNKITLLQAYIKQDKCNLIVFIFSFFIFINFLIFTIFNKMPNKWKKISEDEKPNEIQHVFLYRNKFNIKNSFVTTWNIWRMFYI